jgi:SAM-dependent methyltransferase
MIDTSAFDNVSAGYDGAFTNTPLGHLLRQRVWQVLSGCFQSGEQVLELACGTGADAVWLGRQGIQVTATDGSAEMTRIAASKVGNAGLQKMVAVEQLSLQQISAGELPYPMRFDGIFSNFGGLNTIAGWRPLARTLAQIVRPAGWVVLVVMGPVCPWESGWYLWRGQWRTAIRRWRSPSQATIGQATIPVWYPSPRRLRRDFAPWFRARRTLSLGFWLPPTYLGKLVERAPRLFAWLNRLEGRTAHLTAGWGDHYILLLQREPGDN